MAQAQVKVFTEEMYGSPEIAGLKDFLATVKQGEPWRIATERLLRLNGNVKRGRNVNMAINDALKVHGLVSKPSIENADYYGEVVISDPRDELRGSAEVVALPVSAFSGELRSLVYCGTGMTARKVQALMVGDDISQIPVLSSDRKSLHGVVTWRSLAQYRGDLGVATAEDVMGPRSHVVSSSDDFLDLVSTIIEQEFVLYRAPDGKVEGIVTASDLAQAFNGSTGIYIQLRELENRLRVLLDKSSIPDLQQHLEPKRRSMKRFRGARDMMFGEYLSALRDAKIWQETGIEFDQEYCLKLFARVKDFRNDRMHFATDAAGAAELQDDVDPGQDEQRTVTRALRILRSVGLG